MNSMLLDLKVALRSLLRRPAFALAAVVCAALGIGLCTTVFSACYAMLLRPFPFADAEDLLTIVVDNPQQGIEKGNVSYLDFEDLRRQSSTFARIGGHSVVAMTLTGKGEPERILGAAVSADLFKVLGVEPQLGRQFLPEEDRQGAAGAVMLSYNLWQRSFLGDPNIVGSVVQVDSSPYRVVGVMPPGFEYPTHQQAWVPIAPRLAARDRKVREVALLGRLAPGIGAEQAQAEVKTLGQNLINDFPELGRALQYRAITLRELHVSPGMRIMSWSLLGAALSVLLIACANVANLLIARAESRNLEISVRVALGASPGRIRVQVLIESLILAVAGGLVGLLLAALGVKMLILLFPASNPVPYWMSFSLDLPVLLFTLVITLLVCLLSGWAPAAQSSRPDLSSVLSSASRGNSGRGRMRSVLVVAEVALSLSLLIGAALFVRSFFMLKDADSGFREDALVTFRLHLSGEAYNEEADRVQKMQEILRRLEALPGVESAYTSTLVPLATGGASAAVEISGREIPPEEKTSASWAGVSPGFFGVLQVPVEAGRGFTDAEGWDRAKVVVINRRFAERFFPGADPLGQQIKLTGVAAEQWLTVIGVVKDFKTRSLDRPHLASAFVPYPFRADRNSAVVLRTKGDPSPIMQAARGEVRALEPGIPIFDMALMKDVREASIWQFQLVARLFSAFGILALFLAATGLYGVLSYFVSQRWREIGIRIALGAQRRAVVLLIMRQGMTLVLAGLALGLLGAFLLTRVLSSMLYGISATDPWSFGLLTLFQLLVAAVANYFPARRATRVDPIEALRES